MSKEFSCVHDEELIGYIQTQFRPEDPVLRHVREAATKEGLPTIQVAAMDGLHLEIFTRLQRPKKIVEIGTLGGYSGICLLRGAGPDAHLDTFEISEKNAGVAHRAFVHAGLENQVTIHIGPALDKLSSIESKGPFDLVFIDADKFNYVNYLDWSERNLKTGGVVIGDNTFAFGKLAREPKPGQDDGESLKAMREFNRRLAQGGKFRSTILPTGEGLTVGVKL